MKSALSNMCIQIVEDFRRHGREWTKLGFRSVAVHRFGVWRMTVKSKILRAPLSLLYRWGYRHCRNIYGIELPYRVKLGRRVVFEHQGGIVVHGRSSVSGDCIIRQKCTPCIRRISELDKAPTLEAGVSIGAGAVILGAVTLGQGCAVARMQSSFRMFRPDQ